MQRKKHENHFAPGQLDVFMIQTEKACTNVNRQCLVDRLSFLRTKTMIIDCNNSIIQRNYNHPS